MKKFLIFLVMSVVTQIANAQYNVVMVSPRGETSMEGYFKEELQRLVGKKINFTFIKPDLGNKSEIAALPALVKSKNPHLVYTWGTPATLAVAGTVRDPLLVDPQIVFAVVANPVKSDIVISNLYPGRNITGVQHLPALRTQILAMQEYKKFKTFGVVYNPQEPNALIMVDELRVEAGLMGLKLIAVPVDLDPVDKHPIAKQIPVKITQLKKMGAEWLYMGPDTFIGYTNRRLTTFSALNVDLPAFTANESAIRDGHALYGLFSPIENLGKFAALKAAKILNGEQLAVNIPVETLQKFTHVVNLCTANSLKLYPSMNLFRTGDVIFPKKTPDDKGCDEFS